VIYAIYDGAQRTEKSQRRSRIRHNAREWQMLEELFLHRKKWEIPAIPAHTDTRLLRCEISSCGR